MSNEIVSKKFKNKRNNKPTETRNEPQQKTQRNHKTNNNRHQQINNTPTTNRQNKTLNMNRNT